MKDKIMRLIKSPFVRNVTVMASGTAAAQIITMVFSPIITRLYGPEAFGIMGTFLAITSIVAPIAALTYPIAIVLPKKNQDAKGLVRLSLIITIFISMLSFVLLIFFHEQIVDLFNLKEISNFLYLIPCIIIFSGLMQVAEQWLIRSRQFAVSARVTFLHSLVLNGSKIGIGYFNPAASALVLITAFGNGLKAAMMLFSVKRSWDSERYVRHPKKGIRELATEYYDFPTFRAPEVFLNAISHGLPVLMLTAFFGPASAGFYTIGRTVLNIPSQLIGKSVGDVFYPRIAEAFNKKENITALIKKATLALAVIGIIPFGTVVLFGPFLFSFVFGSDWSVAGEYARWIAIWSYFGFMNRPSVRALPVISAQKFHLIYTIIMLITRLGVLAIGYYIFLNDLIAISLFGISGAILNLGLITFTLKFSKKEN